MALEYADFLADCPEVSGHLVADPACETVLAKSVAVEVRIDRSRVRLTAIRMAGVDEDTHGSPHMTKMPSSVSMTS